MCQYQEEATQDERVYIKELYNAYGDAEGLDSFSEKDLSSYPDYAEDLEDRRIDYYAAESIRRGVLELKADKLIGQFEVLKKRNISMASRTQRDALIQMDMNICLLLWSRQLMRLSQTTYSVLRHIGLTEKSKKVYVITLLMTGN